MLFVSTGTYSAGFDRLIKEIDLLAKKGIVKNVVAQIGYSKYTPQFIIYKRFFDEKQMQMLTKKSKFLILQGGAGTIKNSLKYGKKIIVVPRLKRYNEYFNDHQIEIANFLGNQKRILVAYNINQLGRLIKEIDNFHPAKINADKNKIAELIENFIEKKG